MKIKSAIGTEEEERVVKREFRKIESISMDYGIIEKTKDLFVVPADFGWADVGNWRTVKDILSKSKKKNIIKGKVINLEGENNLIYNYSKKIVTLIGVRGMVVIETDKAVLICPKNRAQDIKKIVKEIKDKGLKKYL